MMSSIKSKQMHVDVESNGKKLISITWERTALKEKSLKGKKSQLLYNPL